MAQNAFCANLLELKARVKKVVIAIIGSIVLLIGVAMIVLPGPAFLVIPAGLAILATEFEWAERWKQRVLHWFREARAKHRRKKEQRRQLYLT
ncbi:MAG: PGPGW domain-containing protein [Limisphaerales bacterium]